MKKYVLITGSGGLIGSDSVEFFIKKKFYIIGIENNYRKFFFGKDGSITKRNNYLLKNYKNYICNNFNLKNLNLTKNVFKNYKSKIKCKNVKIHFYIFTFYIILHFYTFTRLHFDKFTIL